MPHSKSREEMYEGLLKLKPDFQRVGGHSLKPPARRKSEGVILDHARIILQKYGLISGCPSSIHSHTAAVIREFDPTA